MLMPDTAKVSTSVNGNGFVDVECFKGEHDPWISTVMIYGYHTGCHRDRREIPRF